MFVVACGSVGAFGRHAVTSGFICLMSSCHAPNLSLVPVSILFSSEEALARPAGAAAGNSPIEARHRGMVFCSASYVSGRMSAAGIRIMAYGNRGNHQAGNLLSHHHPSFAGACVRVEAIERAWRLVMRRSFWPVSIA